MKKIFFGFILLSITYLLAACGETNINYHVTFVDYDGTVLEKYEVAEGDNATLPIPPTRVGYEFGGWVGTITNIQKDEIIIATYTIKNEIPTDHDEPEIEEPEIEEPEIEEPEIEEPEIEEPLMEIPNGATVVISRTTVSEEILAELIKVDEWFLLGELIFEQIHPANHVIIVYDSLLLKEMPPIVFGISQIHPMQVIVTQVRDRTFTLIHPGAGSHVEEFLGLLSPENLLVKGENTIPHQVIIEEMYPFLTQYGKIGILTNITTPGDYAPFLPIGTHSIYNNPNSFMEEDLDTRVIIYPFDSDLGFSPSRFGKTVERGEVVAFTDEDGVRTILIRERFNERLEWFFLGYEVLGLNGTFDSQYITGNFQPGAPLYRGTSLSYQTRPFQPRTKTFEGDLTPLDSLVAPIDFCKIQQSNRIPSPFGHPDTNDNLGFPMLYNVPPIGEVNIAIVAIDFPDVPGEENYLPIYLSQVETLQAWAEFVSDGKMTYNVQFPTQWIRAPREARYYSRMGGYSPNLERPEATVTQPFEESVKQLVLASDQYIDWSVIDFVQFVFPVATYQYATDLQGPIENLYTPRSGLVSFWAWGGVDEKFRPDNPDPKFRTLWDWIVHEVLHYQGIVGHAPLNGGPYSIMMDQHGESKALLSWEAFLMGYLDETHIACIDPATIDEPIHIQLESLDKTGGSPGIKSLMIPVDEFETVVIEYRTDGPFSNLSPEFQGFTAYYINVDAERVRCDWCDPMLMEFRNFKRYLRNATETLVCDKGYVIGQPVCDHLSIVQYPGFHLDFFGIRLEFYDDGKIVITRLY